MRIALDGRCINSKKSGVGVYTESLFNALLDVDEANEYAILTTGWTTSDRVNLRLIKTRFSIDDHPLGDMWEHFFLPLFLKRKKIDLFHSPTFHAPFLSFGTTRMVTIHDLVAFRFPYTQPRRFVEYSRFMLKRSARLMDGIIVPSMAIKEEVVNILGVEETKVYVVPEAHRPIFHRVNDKEHINTVKNRYGLPDEFILSVGVIEPRKNLTTLIKAYTVLKRTVRIPHKLVICGTRGWLNEYDNVLRTIHDCGVMESVIFTGYVNDEDLMVIYSMADLFVYPSIYEGFGLPPLEAMACGCPVVTSNASSLPEVVGDGGIMVNPKDVEALVHAMQRVLTDDSFRKELENKGEERVKCFSWKRSAIETLRIYKEVAGRM